MTDVSILFSADDERLRTAIGEKEDGQILVHGGTTGCALYGPYAALPRGQFRAKVHFAADATLKGKVVLEVTTGRGKDVVASARFSLPEQKIRQIELPFTLSQPASGCEIRLQCGRDVTATITGAEIIYVGQDSSVVETALARGAAPTDAIFARLDALERLIRGGQGVYVGNNRIMTRVNAGSADLVYFMPADDRLLTPMNWAHGQHESDITRYFLQNVPSTANCLDIGANFGYYTCLMAHLARQGKTMGLEPDPQIFELLRDNIIANSLPRHTEAVHGAISDRAGRMTLYRRDTRSGNTSMGRVTDDYTRKLGEAPAQPFETDAYAVDNLLPRFGGRIDFMKIDVEGAEPLAFRGMRETLAANPQLRIVMEWSPAQMHLAGFDPSAFAAELAEMGLEAAVIGPQGPRPTPLSALTAGVYHSGVLLTQTARASAGTEEGALQSA